MAGLKDKRIEEEINRWMDGREAGRKGSDTNLVFVHEVKEGEDTEGSRRAICQRGRTR